MARIRILVADDHPIVFNGLRQILEPEYEIVGEVQDGGTLVAAAAELRPDVVVSDITMPVLDGIEAIRKIRAADMGVQFIVLTMHTDAAHLNAALRAGASAFVLKSSAGHELLTAIGEVLSGRTFVTPGLS